MTTFVKDPSAVLDYSVDWEAWLDGDTISSSSWTVPAGITKKSDSNTTTAAVIWLEGGTAGDCYTVMNRITTAGGRTEDHSFLVRMEEQ